MAEEPRKQTGRMMRGLTIGGAFVALIAGAVGLLFTLQPGLRPCLRSDTVAFTGAPVFPMSLEQFAEGSFTRRSSNDRDGAEVRYSYRTSGLRGKTLVIVLSLLAVERDGTPIATGISQNRTTTGVRRHLVGSCSETFSNSVWVPTPASHGRYRIILEIYPSPVEKTGRLALSRTDVFHR